MDFIVLKLAKRCCCHHVLRVSVFLFVRFHSVGVNKAHKVTSGNRFTFVIEVLA